MSGFTIIVFSEGVPSYVAGWHEDRADVDSQVSSMIAETSKDGEEVVPVFAGSDDIVVFDVNGKAISAWNRNSTSAVEDFASFDLANYLDSDAERRAITMLGFQMQNLGGENIQGTPYDLFQLRITDVLKDGAVLTAKEWAADKDFLVEPVYSNEIYDATYVSEIEIKEDYAATNRL
jgi:hypothetical protein